MKRSNSVFHVGDLKITRLDELTLTGSAPEVLFPGDWQPEALEQHREWLSPQNFDFSTGKLIQSTHAWLVQSPNFTLLVDTASGNDKERGNKPIFHHLQTDFLAQLERAGVTPESVDYVLLTHLHVDHVGWNTRLVDGKWQPTFPNATYFFSQNEADFYGDAESDSPAVVDNRQVFADSVQPIIDAGQFQLVPPGGGEVLAGIRYTPTPGHSIDHMSVSILSQGKEAFFAGDLLHHPLQVYYPELNSMYCGFDGPARASRLWALHHAAENQVTWFSTHFADSSAGRVTQRGNDFQWTFLQA